MFKVTTETYVVRTSTNTSTKPQSQGITYKLSQSGSPIQLSEKPVVFTAYTFSSSKVK